MRVCAMTLGISSRRSGARHRRALLGAFAVAALAFCAGCQQPLFPSNASRTQFDRYDAVRSGATPTEEPDVFGRPQPALRARLAPKNQ